MLLDTSGLLCLHHKAELFHVQACYAYKTARFRMTHNYILAEFVALANARRIPRMATLMFISDLAENPDIETIWVEKHIHNEALQLLLSRQDKTYSLCDAVSFILMRRYNISESLTTDSHFEQEGFRRLLT